MAAPKPEPIDDEPFVRPSPPTFNNTFADEKLHPRAFKKLVLAFRQNFVKVSPGALINVRRWYWRNTARAGARYARAWGLKEWCPNLENQDEDGLWL